MQLELMQPENENLIKKKNDNKYLEFKTRWWKTN